MRKTLEVLNRLERDEVIGRYAIGGAMAATFYIEPFTTFDLDVFVILSLQSSLPLASLSPIYEALHGMGYADEKECIIVEGVPVQFLPAYSALVEEALGQAVEVPYEDLTTRVFSAEHLVAIALQTGRGKDRARVQMFLDAGVLDKPRLSDILARFGLESRWKSWTEAIA
jgi:hypothetical protein